MISIEVGTVSPTAQHPRGGGVRMPGFRAAEQRSDVRHLVIFRAPVVGYARPAAAGAPLTRRPAPPPA